jgi:hypothetical protein
MEIPAGGDQPATTIVARVTDRVGDRKWAAASPAPSQLAGTASNDAKIVISWEIVPVGAYCSAGHVIIGLCTQNQGHGAATLVASQ